MAWTDDRVARLAKLWAEGLSASQIATDLGGVTRNAVIGKVHRLGLSHRDKPAGKSNGGARRKPAAPRAGGTTPRSARATPRPANSNTTLDDGELKTRSVVEAKTPVEPEIEKSAPESRMLTLMQLTETTCKWPTGDPTMPGFSFCGHTNKDDKPYCDFHNKLAFQPPSERRRRR